MRYHQLTSEERYALSAFRKQGYNQSQIANALGRHRSTIGRELQRNSRKDGGYRPSTADDFTRGRRSRSRRNWRFTEADLELVRSQLEEWWSPEQISGRLRRQRVLRISHETIYRYIWNDMLRGGSLHVFCAVLESDGANAMALTTHEGDSPESDTFQSDPQLQRSDHELVILKETR